MDKKARRKEVRDLVAVGLNDICGHVVDGTQEGIEFGELDDAQW